jgi:hypothetical protein
MPRILPDVSWRFFPWRSWLLGVHLLPVPEEKIASLRADSNASTVRRREYATGTGEARLD